MKTSPIWRDSIGNSIPENLCPKKANSYYMGRRRRVKVLLNTRVSN